MKQNRIDYTIGFKVDQTGAQQATGSLNAIIQDLKQINSMPASAFNITNLNNAEQEIQNIRAAAVAVGNALTDSFNKDLGTYNLTTFRQKLHEAGFSVKDIGTYFSQAGDVGAAAFTKVSNAATQTQRIAKNTTGVFDELGKTLANTVRWTLTSGLIHSILNSIKGAWNYAVKLDASLNDIRIVTGKSAEEMEKFSQAANSAAQELGTSTTAYTQAALIYYQQGLSDAEVMEKAEITAKAANVTGQSAQEVSEQLTAVWNGYKVATDEAELYIDKLAAVAASTAANLEEISDAMAKVASAAAEMGVNIDQLTAHLSTVISVTRQDAATVGTAFKTIYARMGDLEVDGVDEFGVKLGDVSSKLSVMGINILDQQGNLREMGTVIEEVAAKWDTWTDAQQQAAAVALAGKRQYNNLIALFSNWDMVQSAQQTSENAEGTLDEQQEIYEERMRAMIDSAKAAGETIKESLFDAESVEFITSAIKELSNTFGGMIKALGGLKTVLPMLIGFMLQTKTFGGMVGKGFQDAANSLGAFKEQIKNISAARADIKEFGAGIKTVSNTLAQAQSRGLVLKDMLNKGYIDEETFYKLDELNNAVKRNAVSYQDAIKASKAYVTTINDGTKKIDKTINFSEIYAAGAELRKKQPAISEEDLYKNTGVTAIADIYGEASKQINARVQEINNAGSNIDPNNIKVPIDKINDAISSLSKNPHLAGQTQEIEKLQAELGELYTKYGESPPADGLALIKLKIQEIIEKAQQMGANYSSSADKIVTSCMQAARGIDPLAAAQEKLVGSTVAFNKGVEGTGFKTAVFSRTLVTATSTVTMLATSIRSLSNIIQGLRDGTTDVGDAIFSIISIVGMAIPVIVNLVNTASNSIAIAGAKAQSAWGWISLILTAAAAIVGGVVWAISSALKEVKTEFDIIQEQIDAAEERVKEFQTALKETREEYQTLLENMSDYKDAKLALDEMRQGTEEWQDAVKELNADILELISTYPTLAGYVTSEDGIYNVSEEGWDVLKEQQQKEIQDATRLSIAGNLNALKLKNELIYKETPESRQAYEAYNQAIEKMTNATVEERGALQETLAALSKANASLIANTAQMKMQTEAYRTAVAESMGVENTDVFSNLLDKGIVQGTNLQDYIDAIQFINDGKSIKTNSKTEYVGSQFGTKHDRQIAKERTIELLNELYGVGQYSVSGLSEELFSKVKADKIGEVSIKVNGEEVTIDKIIARLAEKRMADADFALAEETAKLVTKFEEKGVAAEAAYFASEKLSSENLLSLWSGASIDELKNLEKISVSTVDSTFSDVDYQNKLEEFRTLFLKQANKILGESSLEAIQDLNASTDVFKDFTADDFKDFVLNTEKIANLGGQAFIEALTQKITDPQTLSTINKLMSNADFANSVSVKAFYSNLLAEKVDLPEEVLDHWNEFFSTLLDGTRQWYLDSSNVIDNLKSIKEIAADVSVGEAIDPEDLQALTTIAPEITNAFIEGADGMISLISGSELEALLEKQYADLIDLNKEYKNIVAAAENYGMGVTGFSAEKLSQNDRKEFFDDTAIELAKAIGIKESDIQSNLEILKTRSTYSTEYIAATELLNSYAEQINQAALDASSGELREKNIKGQELWATELADSWLTVKNNIDNLDADVFDKASKLWANTFLTELGFEELYLSGQETDELFEQVKIFRELELDYLDTLEKKAATLQTKVDQLFGAERLKQINELLTVYQESANQAQRESEIAANLYETLKNDIFSENNFELLFSDVDFSSAFGEDGVVDITEILDLQLNYSKDSKQYATLEKLVEYWETAEEAAQTANEKQQEYIDAQIESINYQQEMVAQFKDFQLDWLDFYSTFNKWKTKGDFSVFNDQDFNSQLNNLIGKYNIQSLGVSGQIQDLELIRVEEITNSSLLEQWEEDLSSAKDNIFNLQDIIRDGYELLVSSSEEILNIYDAQIEKLSSINEILKNQIDLAKILNIDSSSMYSATTQNALEIYNLAVAEMAIMQEEYDKQIGSAEGEYKDQLIENLASANNTLIESAKNYLESLSNDFSYQLSSGIDEIFQTVTGGNLQFTTEQWEREVNLDERYLDEINSIYGKDELIRKFQKSINETNSLSAQKKLNEVLKEQLKYLEEKDKLSQYDLDRANAIYDLTLKQIALEEAQQNANKLKLTRDIMGNYTYQYVADQEAISEAESEFEEAKNKLYNLDKDQVKASVDEWYSTVSTAVKEINDLVTQGRLDEAELVKEYYFGKQGVLANMKADISAATANLTEVGEKLQNENWLNSFANYTDAINKMDFTALSQSLTSLLGEGGELRNAQDSLTELFDSDSVLVQSISSLTNNLGEIDQTAVSAIVNATSVLLDKEKGLTPMIQKVGDLAAALNAQANKYSEYMAKQIGSTELDKNTTALTQLTGAVIELKDAFDNGSIDGSIGGNWIWNENTMSWEIEANTSFK